MSINWIGKKSNLTWLNIYQDAKLFSQPHSFGTKCTVGVECVSLCLLLLIQTPLRVSAHPHSHSRLPLGHPWQRSSLSDRSAQRQNEWTNWKPGLHNSIVPFFGLFCVIKVSFLPQFLGSDRTASNTRQNVLLVTRTKLQITFHTWFPSHPHHIQINVLNRSESLELNRNMLLQNPGCTSRTTPPPSLSSSLSPYLPLSPCLSIGWWTEQCSIEQSQSSMDPMTPAQ